MPMAILVAKRIPGVRLTPYHSSVVGGGQKRQVVHISDQSDDSDSLVSTQDKADKFAIENWYPFFEVCTERS